MKRKNSALTAALLLAQNAAALSEPWNGIATKIQGVLCDFYAVFWNIIGVLAVVVIIAAAVQWILSRDDPGKRKQAQTIIIAALVGVIIAIITRSIITAVTTSFPSLQAFECTTVATT